LSQFISLEVIDVDGTVREAAESAGATRRDVLRNAGIAGGAALAGGVLFNGLISPAEAAISTKNRSKKNDIKILQYALTLEYLEAEFYKQANASGAIKKPDLKRFAEVTGKHEAEHVAALKKVLGKKAPAVPTFDFKDTVTDQDKFAATAQAVEDIGVSAYAGQGPNIFQKAVIVPALAIHSVEARHAAWIRFINSGGQGEESVLPAPASFDAARTEKAVLKLVGGTGFIVS
jgi:hypothetical protein